MKNLFLIFVLALVLSSCNNNISEKSEIEEFPLINITTYTNERNMLVLSRNELTKEADISIKVFMRQEDLMLDLGADWTEFITQSACEAIAESYFDPSLSEKIRLRLESNDVNGEYEEYPNLFHLLYGYNIKNVTVSLEEKETEKRFSSCIITGLSKEEIKIEIP